jgi:hypothetical protein
MITAIAAGIISLSALSVSLYEAYLMRMESRVAVLPILETWSFHGSEGFGVNVANKGIGPAMIRSVEVSRDGAAARSWAAVYEGVLEGDPPAFSLAMITGNVMMPGEIVPAIQVERSEAARQLWISSESVSMTICYCSIYEECWIQTLDNVRAGVPRTEPAASCEVNEESRF